MKNRILVLGALLFLIAAGAGCKNSDKKNSGDKQTGNSTSSQNVALQEPEVADDADQIFEEPTTRVSFHYMGYLKKTEVKISTGSVSIVFKRRESSKRPIDTLYFTAKTRDAFLQEKKNAAVGLVCESYTQYGCDKWDEDFALYNKAMSQNEYSGYYGFGGSRVTLNGITYVMVVDYNLERQQYQTRYIGFINNTRITFTDPATGGLEYGVPFQMNARNREMIEKTGDKIAKRQKIDDLQTHTRAEALHQIVSSLKLMK